jgi:predicted nucleic acid-binding protein
VRYELHSFSSPSRNLPARNAGDTIPAPYIYIDTNVILDVAIKRNNKSVDLLAAVRERGIRICTSHFSMMEALGVRQEHLYIINELQRGERVDKILRNRGQRSLSHNDLITVYNELIYSFYEQYEDILDYWYLTQRGWENATVIMTKINISAMDAVHVATAVEAGCDRFVSSDTALIKNAKSLIPAYPPDKMLREI